MQLLPYVALFLSLGLALQGAVGFGCGLFAIPLMVAVGVPLPVSIAVVLAGVLGQTAWGSWQYRHHIEWRSTWGLTLLRGASMPVGVWLLGMLAEQSQPRVKTTIGIVLLTVLIAQWTLRVQPRDHVATGWTTLAGITSGLMAGLLGMGGPPIVLWVMAHDWDGRRARAFQWAIFLQLMPLQIALLVFMFGPPVTQGIVVGLALLPLSLLASTIGMKLGEQLSRRHLRVAAYCLLIAIAGRMIVG